MFRAGEDRQQKVLVFQAHMAAVLRQKGCLDAVETDERTGAGRIGADEEAPKKDFGDKKAEKMHRASL